MATRYFTADLHLGHENIIRYCNRPFANVEEMDESLLAKWNEAVKENDVVYILGDLFYRNSVPAEQTLKAMKGKKHLILGNHDKGWVKGVDLSKYFVETSNLLTYKLDGVKYTLCHYPMLSWEGRGNGGYMIHGHVHNNRLEWNNDYLLNAGVDVNNFKPVTLEELVANNAVFRGSADGISEQTALPNCEPE